MNISGNTAKKPSYFWFIYGAAALILSFGCVAGDQDDEIGEIGVCGFGAERWGEARGDAGYLAFYHALNSHDLSSSPRYYEFNPLIAEGTFSTYFVSHWNTGEPARVVEVTSSDPSVIAAVPVQQSNQTYFDVDAIRPGTADITVRTQLGTADRIRLTVTDLASIDGYHCCTSSDHALYLTDTDIEIPVTYISSYGETPIGFGWLPFEVGDESLLQWRAEVGDPADIHFRTGSRAGTTTLRPRVSGRPITVGLVEPEELDDISVHWHPDRADSGQWIVGATLLHNDEALCAGKYPMRATSRTPRVCRFVDADGYSVDSLDFEGDQTLLLQLIREGECTLDVELLDRRGRRVLEKRSRRQLEFDYYGDDYYY